MGALESSQTSRTPWTPNYSDVANSVVAKPTDGFVDYLDVMSSAGYAQYVIGSKVGQAASQAAAQRTSDASTVDQPPPRTQPNYDGSVSGVGPGAATPGQFSYESGQQQQQSTGGNGQWRAGYGSDVGRTFQPGQQQQGAQNGGQWRAGYGSDVGRTFQPGQQTQSTGQWRPTYGQDVNNNFVAGQQTQSDGQWRPTYGQDVNNNFVAGQQNQNDGQSRPTYGQDVNNNVQSGTGTGQQGGEQQLIASNSEPQSTSGGGGAWRPQYGGDVGTTFRPGASTDGSSSTYNPNANGSTYNPNANGDANSGAYNPNANGNATMQVPKWQGNLNNIPQMAQGRPDLPAGSPQAQAGRPGTPQTSSQLDGPHGSNFWKHQNDTVAAVDRQLLPNSVSVPGMLFMGGVSGMVGGQAFTPLVDKLANTVLLDRKAKEIPGGRLTGWAESLPNSWRKKVTPAVNKTESVMNNVGSTVAGENGGVRQRMAQAWKDNFDPQNKVLQDMQLKADQAKDNLGKLNLDLERAKARRADFLADLKAKDIDIKTTQDPEILGQAEKILPEVDTIETAISVEKNALLAKSGGLLNKDILREKAAGFGSNFLAGAGAAGVGMVVDDGLDRLFGKHDHKFGLSATTALTIPAALSLGENWKQKLGYSAAFAVGGYFAGKALDAVLPKETSQSFGQALRPNGVDAATMGFAIALPANDVRTKLALTTMGWFTGRMSNVGAGESLLWAAGGAAAGVLLAPNKEMKTAAVVADAAGWAFSRWEHSRYPGTDGADKNDTAWKSVTADSSKRTKSSMDDAIDKMKDLGKSSQGALQFYFNDWCRKNRSFPDQVTAYRGATILTAALGESRLDLGPVIKQDAHNNPTAYMPGMAGMDLDLGGQALKSLLLSENCVNAAVKNTQANLGKTINGHEVTQSEVDDLNKVGQEVSDTINNRVYGKHDIDKSFDYFSGWYHNNLEDGGHFIESVQRSITLNLGQKSYNKQFVAKLCRDEALMKMGVAQFNINSDAGGAKSAIYGNPYSNGGPPDGAAGLLQLAAQLDPNNPDLPELNKLLNGYEQKIPGAVNAQVSNPHYNPLNVGNALPPVKQ